MKIPRNVACALLLLTSLVIVAQEPQQPAPADYAPIVDVAAQVQMYIEQIDDDLANPDEYSEEQQDRVLKSANTLIVLAQVLANHNEQHALKKAAPQVAAAAQKLTESSDHATAMAAQAELKASLDSVSDEQLDWTPQADLVELMKQVPIVNNKLRSGVNGTRFKRLIDQNAGHAVTLAAIAESSRHYTDYCSGPEEEMQWAAICAKMRDAAAEVRAAVRMEDQQAAKAGLARLVTTCDECHHAFRD